MFINKITSLLDNGVSLSITIKFVSVTFSAHENLKHNYKHSHTVTQRHTTTTKQQNKLVIFFNHRLICFWADDPLLSIKGFIFQHLHGHTRRHIPAENLPLPIHTGTISPLNPVQPESMKVMLAALNVWRSPQRREARSRQGRPVRAADRTNLWERHQLI